MDFPEEIVTDRLLLKRPLPITFDLANRMFQVVDSSREVLRKWLPWVDWTSSVEDEYDNFLLDGKKQWDEGVAYTYMITEPTGKIVGVIGPFDINKDNKSAVIGYWLASDATGHGYIHEALKAIEDVAFAQGINRLVITNDTENTRSVNVAKRAGYHLDGTMRQDSYSPYFKGMRNTYVWSKLQSEWQASR